MTEKALKELLQLFRKRVQKRTEPHKPAQLPLLKCRTFAMRKEICGI